MLTLICDVVVLVLLIAAVIEGYIKQIHKHEARVLQDRADELIEEAKHEDVHP